MFDKGVLISKKNWSLALLIILVVLTVGWAVWRNYALKKEGAFRLPPPTGIEPLKSYELPEPTGIVPLSPEKLPPPTAAELL